MSKIVWDKDYRVGYMPTDDPRLIGVIERDEHHSVADLDWCYLDGVRINDDYGSRREGTWLGCDCHDCPSVLRDAVERAEREWGANSWRYADDERIARYLRIFHGVEIVELHSTVDQYVWAEVLVPVGTYDPKDYAWLQAYLDGDVFGVGYGINAELVEHPEVFDPSSYTIDMVCWGFYGAEDAVDHGLTDHAFPEAGLDRVPLLF